MVSRSTVPAVLILLGLANVILLWVPWGMAVALGIYGLLMPLPGILLAGVLLRHRHLVWLDTLLYGVGAGYGCAIVLLLALSYLPGGLSGWAVIIAADLLVLALALISWKFPWPIPQSVPLRRESESIWLWAGVLTLLVLAAFLRLTNLGYSEFQGDEARAILRAAAVIQGYEDVLLLHRKGPAEILLPTSLFAVNGLMNEMSARIPFTLANIVGGIALFRLGWRLFNPLAGWIAAMLFVVDGYFIGFARIVQYQSLVLLAMILVVLLLYELYRRPTFSTGPLSLVGWILAMGIFAHYEAVLVLIPAAYLLGMILWRNKAERGSLVFGIGLASLIGIGALALFYVPFVRHPNFADTFAYLTGERIGGTLPYNNILPFLRQTIVYSSSYYLVFVALPILAGLVAAYWRGLGFVAAVVVTIIGLVTLSGSLFQRDWLLVAGQDWTVVPVALLLLGACFLPKLRFEERLLWLWFGSIFILALFLVEKPNTHVYTFLLPLLLLVGMLVASVWALLQRRLGEAPARYGGVAIALLLVVLFANYAYWLFVHTETEVLQRWPEANPTGYWIPVDQVNDHASFGAPHAVGWKAIGALYADGSLNGPYETTEDAWVPAWYTRGQERCQRQAQWYFEAGEVTSIDDAVGQNMARVLERGFSKTGVVQVNETTRMRIYQQTNSEIDQPYKTDEESLPTVQAEAMAEAFDADASAWLPLADPVIEEIPDQVLLANLDGKVWLEGYSIEQQGPLVPGDVVELTLFWRAQAPMDRSYRVFNQSYYDDGKMIAQVDGFPLCDSYETWRWSPGERLVDRHELRIRDSAPPGTYPLVTGLYDPETGERLSVRDEQGTAIDSQVHLTDITIVKETE